ncbi:NAD(P)H-dependent oxidoreductase [Halobellus salinus]|uniref:NAD(P)H-dependent oxidoreductase n=1 Tax=Halobellus salinus TaxID=931585 RepID=A0A830ELX8_9EURY|nr:NADPH-dependent FMN reductase [Halobellus salinus]GGJ03753.1 NAD(P)H-dependent oxidoreductase [Halobellus salinus]SMP20987.1 NAD(P)H-dependent FMN reductase [Halobellus salinus]
MAADTDGSGVHVVALCGSLRDSSCTQRAVERALDGARAAGGTGAVIDLREHDLPPLDPDVDSQGDSDAVVRRVRGADAVLLGTPMYHGSYSGVLKNALDHCGFDEFEGKTVGLLAVAGGGFPVPALDHLRSVCRALDAWVLPHQVAVPNAASQFEAGEVVDDRLDERVRVLGRRVVAYAHIEPDTPSFEADENVGAVD